MANKKISLIQANLIYRFANNLRKINVSSGFYDSVILLTIQDALFFDKQLLALMQLNYFHHR